MAWTTEQGQRVLAEIRRRAGSDPEFRKLCLTQPAAAVKDVAGVDLPPGFDVRFKEDAHGKLSVIMPGFRDLDLHDGELDRIVGGQTSTCFAAGTPVLMGDGRVKPIEQVRRGDLVMAADERNGTAASRPVTRLLEHASEPIHRAVVEGLADEIYLTPNHPFFAAGDWTQIGTLPMGAQLCRFNQKSYSFSAPRLVALERTDRVEAVYNLEVGVDHTYFVHGLLVHNGGVIRGIGSAIDGVVKK
jgi:hypothetical protein